MSRKRQKRAQRCLRQRNVTTTVKAAESVTLDTPETTLTGNASIAGNLDVAGNISVGGNATVAGILTLAGIVMNTHVHGNGNEGAPTTAPMA